MISRLGPAAPAAACLSYPATWRVVCNCYASAAKLLRRLVSLPYRSEPQCDALSCYRRLINNLEGPNSPKCVRRESHHIVPCCTRLLTTRTWSSYFSSNKAVHLLSASCKLISVVFTTRFSRITSFTSFSIRQFILREGIEMSEVKSQTIWLYQKNRPDSHVHRNPKGRCIKCVAV